jgi:hypothetical protein
VRFTNPERQGTFAYPGTRVLLIRLHGPALPGIHSEEPSEDPNHPTRNAGGLT